MMTAVYLGDMRVVRMLVRHGARLDIRNEAGATPLMVAAYKGHLRAVQWIVEEGGEVNARTPDGQTPLMIAIRNGDSGVVEYLLMHGADVNAKDNQGMTALMTIAHLESRTGRARPDLKSYLAKYGGTVINRQDIMQTK